MTIMIVATRRFERDRDDLNDGHLGKVMSEQQRQAEPAREHLLSPVDRVSELRCGLEAGRLERMRFAAAARP